MAVLFTALFRAASLVWDRELGFLWELVVAPVRRSSLLLGKCLGGTVIGAGQGLLVLALAGLVDVPYSPAVLFGSFVLMLLLAFAVTAFGVLVAVCIKQAQTFTVAMQVLLMPMFFLSGALFPVSGLPAWLGVLNRLDPLTYVVDPLRHLMFADLELSPATRPRLDPGIGWFGWHLPVVLELAVVLALAGVMLGAAIGRFARTE
jgi:ABC-2 type transport system permease protein